MYETGTARQLPAFHVLPGMPPRAGQRHSFDYRLDPGPESPVALGGFLSAW